MTTLRQQFIRELVIRGMSPKTQDAYVRAVRDLALHYHKTPDLVTDEEIKDYLFYLAREKHLSASSVNVAVSGMRCFYDLVLHRECEHLGRVLPRSLKAIRRPRVYSIGELERLFTVGCVHPKHRMFLMTIYGGGLRLGEGCRLQPRHIDSARMQIRIEAGKGRKYGKVVVMRRCSSKTVQRQGSGGMELSITTGCQESGDRRLLVET